MNKWDARTTTTPGLAIRLAALTALSLCGETTLLANGVRLVSQDAFAAARGEAFVATADNPSAIYYNPAGITQLEGNNLRGGINGLYFDPTFQPPAGQSNSGTTNGGNHGCDGNAELAQCNDGKHHQDDEPDR